jgi:hypothetical protein
VQGKRKRKGDYQTARHERAIVQQNRAKHLIRIEVSK